jgi:Zn-finger nucleic acid-binding protein
MFDGSAFCPACGTRTYRIAPQPTLRACPACRTTLASVAVSDVTLLECPACEGVWVGALDFDRICADREARSAVLSRPRTTTPAKAPAAAIHYRPCVVCGKMMNRVNFGRLSGTVIDVCRGHGAFLDGGELHAIAQFISDGGLDRTRQREKADLDEERHRLAQLRMKIEAESQNFDWEHQSAFGDSLLEIRRLLKE